MENIGYFTDLLLPGSGWIYNGFHKEGGVILAGLVILDVVLAILGAALLLVFGLGIFVYMLIPVVNLVIGFSASYFLREKLEGKSFRKKKR